MSPDTGLCIKWKGKNINEIVYDEECMFLDDFIRLPDCLSKCDSNLELVEQFKSVFGSEEAKKASNIIYVWATDKKMTRVRSESKVLYVGKSINSLYQRHYRYYSKETEDWNWKRYNHILNSFGNINFYYKPYDVDGKELGNIERKLIWSYYWKHFEYPPLNAKG